MNSHMCFACAHGCSLPPIHETSVRSRNQSLSCLSLPLGFGMFWHVLALAQKVCFKFLGSKSCCTPSAEMRSVSLDHPEYKSRYQLYGMLQGKSEEVPVRMQSQSVEYVECLPFHHLPSSAITRVTRVTRVIEILISPGRCPFYTREASGAGKHGLALQTEDDA